MRRKVIQSNSNTPLPTTLQLTPQEKLFRLVINFSNIKREQNRSKLEIERLLKNNPELIHSQETKLGNTVLHIAVQRGIMILVKFLIEECQADPMKHNFSNQSVLDICTHQSIDVYLNTKMNEVPLRQLLEAAANGDNNKCLQAINKLPLDTINIFRNSPIKIAFDHGHDATALFLIESNISFHNLSEELPFSKIKSFVKKYPSSALAKWLNKRLFARVKINSFDDIQTLIDMGADVNAIVDVNPDEVQIYLITERKKLIATLNEMEFHTANSKAQTNCIFPQQLNLPINQNAQIIKSSIAECAISFSCEEITNYIIDNISDDMIKGNYYNNNSYALLHYACLTKAPIEIIGRLIQRGADVNAKSKDNIEATPLHMATQENFLAAVKLLVECGADLNARRIDQQTALFLAIRYTNNLSLLQYIVENSKLDINEELAGWLPLYLALYKGKTDFVAYLINKGADINIKCHHTLIKGENKVKKYDSVKLPPGERPIKINALSLAILKGRIAAVRFLCEVIKMDINEASSLYGNNLLLSALKFGHEEIALILIEHGANLNIEDERGLPLLTLAVEGDFSQVIKRLYEKGLKNLGYDYTKSITRELLNLAHKLTKPKTEEIILQIRNNETKKHHDSIKKQQQQSLSLKKMEIIENNKNLCLAVSMNTHLVQRGFFQNKANDEEITCTFFKGAISSQSVKQNRVRNHGAYFYYVDMNLFDSLTTIAIEKFFRENNFKFGPRKGRNVLKNIDVDLDYTIEVQGNYFTKKPDYEIKILGVNGMARILAIDMIDDEVELGESPSEQNLILKKIRYHLIVPIYHVGNSLHSHRAIGHDKVIHLSTPDALTNDMERARNNLDK